MSIDFLLFHTIPVTGLQIYSNFPGARACWTLARRVDTGGRAGGCRAFPSPAPSFLKTDHESEVDVTGGKETPPSPPCSLFQFQVKSKRLPSVLLASESMMWDVLMWAVKEQDAEHLG